ncbi:MAG: TetR/AcrR family transcriptional regulator [Sphingomonadales bacterium]|nr:TetR/AcrR family transcriptional regulator [Sphingomonadales bacterium]
MATRRLGLENSSSRAALMDGVEAVMREDGYAALTARSVATRAGLKHQLVYYYFQTMDDLLMATYQRHIGRVQAQVERAFRQPRPLHAFWEVCSNPFDARLNMEFMAMANHNEAIRAETVAFGESIRRVGLAEAAAQIDGTPMGREMFSPFAVTQAIAAIGSTVGLETTLGINGGHQETRAMVEWWLNRLEPE